MTVSSLTGVFVSRVYLWFTQKEWKMVELAQLFGWLEPPDKIKRPNALENIRPFNNFDVNRIRFWKNGPSGEAAALL